VLEMPSPYILLAGYR